MGVAQGAKMAYKDRAAWDQRYSENGDVFEWYAPYEYIAKRLSAATGVGAGSKVLVLGCGTSGLSRDLYEHVTPSSLTSIDFSSKAVAIQTQRNSGVGGMKFDTVDARKMSFAAESFDVIIAKGSIDAVLCSEGANANIKAALSETARV